MSIVTMFIFIFGMMALGLVLCYCGAALLASSSAFLFYTIVAAALFIGFKGIAHSIDKGKAP
ncbi:MAG: hypothetical protein LBP41_04575 [Holosporaceae bacterium]|nr:hypothetical protein [Holosporaceae bacterium]